MSYRTAKPVSPENTFSGGYCDNTPNLFLKDQYSPYLRNCRFDWQSIVIRPGHSLFASLAAWNYPKWIGSYLRANPANDVLVVRHNIDSTHKLYTLTESGTLTSVSTSSNIASNNRMFFQNVGDVIYCMNWSDPFGKLSWTTYTTPSTWVSNFAPAFSAVFWWSHWASGWSTNSNKVYKSVADNYEDFNSTGADTFTFSEQVVWLSANLQSLFYFTKNTISVTGVGDITDTAWTITYGTRSLNVKEWAANNASIVEVWDATYFLSSSNAINKIARGASIDGFEVADLSTRKYSGISTIMDSLDKDQSESFWQYLPTANIIKWYLKSEWSPINDVCIIYDINKDAFLVDNAKPFYDGVFFKWYNYTLSMLEPKVFQDEIYQDDEDAGIEFEYWTKEFYLSDPTYKKIFWECRTLIDINELASLTQEIWIDWELRDTKVVWSDNYLQASWGIWSDSIGMFPIGMSSVSVSWTDDDYQEVTILRTKWNLNIKWKKIQFRFYNSSLAWKVRLKNISMLVEVLPGIANSLTL